MALKEVCKSIRMLSLDPRTRLLLVPLAGIAAFSISKTLPFMMLVASIALLMLLAGQIKITMKYLIVFAIAFTIDMLTDMAQNASISIMLLTLLYVFTRLGLLAMLGTYISHTISSSELICALDKMRLPKQITIPVAVALRFAPTIREEYGYLKDSMKIRGINVSFTGFLRKPGRTIEYTFVPLLIRSFKISDELAASAMVRGIDNGRKKTSLRDLKWRTGDYLTSIIFSAIFAGLIIFQNIF